jgi:hypothetical protein
MIHLDDLARFQMDDRPEVVAASFACPLCLGRASWLMLVEADGGASAGCRCMSCDVAWMVLLDSWQYMRLALAPPRGLLVANASRSRESLERLFGTANDGAHPGRRGSERD